jgi:hypothetical protein
MLMHCGIFVAFLHDERIRELGAADPVVFELAKEASAFAAPAATSGYGTASDQSPVDLERISRCCPSAQK